MVQALTKFVPHEVLEFLGIRTFHRYRSGHGAKGSFHCGNKMLMICAVVTHQYYVSTPFGKAMLGVGLHAA
jgi:hypothetical protein